MRSILSLFWDFDQGDLTLDGSLIAFLSIPAGMLSILHVMQMIQRAIGA